MSPQMFVLYQMKEGQLEAFTDPRTIPDVWNVCDLPTLEISRARDLSIEIAQIRTTPVYPGGQTA